MNLKLYRNVLFYLLLCLNLLSCKHKINENPERVYLNGKLIAEGKAIFENHIKVWNYYDKDGFVVKKDIIKYNEKDTITESRYYNQKTIIAYQRKKNDSIERVQTINSTNEGELFYNEYCSSCHFFSDNLLTSDFTSTKISYKKFQNSHQEHDFSVLDSLQILGVVKYIMEQKTVALP